MGVEVLGDCGMPELQEMLATMPDTFGLQEYYITEIVTEAASQGNVRVVCGVKRGDTIHWLYSVVMPAAKLLVAARQCEAAAVDAFNSEQMSCGSGVH